jgi:hypothetical protein
MKLWKLSTNKISFEIIKQMSWVDAQAKCCSLGMKLFVVDRPEHLDRVRTAMQQKVDADNIFHGQNNHLQMAISA